MSIPLIFLIILDYIFTSIQLDPTQLNCECVIFELYCQLVLFNVNSRFDANRRLRQSFPGQRENFSETVYSSRITLVPNKMFSE